MRRGLFTPTIALAVLLAVTITLHVLWLDRFRRGYLTEWDEAGYIQIAILDRAGLAHEGLVGLARTVVSQPVEAPFVPFATVAVYLIAGVGVFTSLLILPVFFALLVVATYLLARELVQPWWAVLAATVAASIPAVTDYTRLYHFAMPAALWVTVALWALIRSDGFDRRRYSLAFGAALGLMVLTRTMTLSYLPGFAIAALVQVLQGHRTTQRALNAALATAAALVVAATWYGRNVRNVWDYLSSAGYGSTSGLYGRSQSPTSLSYWTRELSLIAQQLYVPLAAAILACFAAWAIARLRPWQRLVSDDRRSRGALSIILVVAAGYFFLTSSSNEGTAFALPLLPALTVLGVTAAASVRPFALRYALAVALLGVAATNLLMKGGFVEPLARPRSLDLPVLHRTPILNGFGIIQEEVAGSGYPVGSATEPLPKLHRLWTPDTERVVRFIRSKAAAADVAPRVLVAADDNLFNNTRLRLASALLAGQYMPVGRLTSVAGGDRTTAYMMKIRSYHANAIVIAPRHPGTRRTITLAKIIAAARETGFSPARRFALPDNRRAWVWLKLFDGTPASSHN
ncbi:MAG: ArnT family glycosyltransferase [Gaiellaceae bacterium]